MAIAPKKCLTKLLKPIEKDDFGYFSLTLLLLLLLLLLAAAALQKAAPGQENTRARKDGEA